MSAFYFFIELKINIHVHVCRYRHTWEHLWSPMSRVSSYGLARSDMIQITISSVLWNDRITIWTRDFFSIVHRRWIDCFTLLKVGVTEVYAFGVFTKRSNTVVPYPLYTAHSTNYAFVILMSFVVVLLPWTSKCYPSLQGCFTGTETTPINTINRSSDSMDNSFSQQ